MSNAHEQNEIITGYVSLTRSYCAEMTRAEFAAIEAGDPPLALVNRVATDETCTGDLCGVVYAEVLP